MKFEKGKSGNPSGLSKMRVGRVGGVGRPRSGRMEALEALDGLLGRSKSRRMLMAALAKALKADPIGFFKTIIMPLLPKESKVSVANDGIVEWKSLVEAFPKPVVPAAPPAEEQSCRPA